MEAVVVGVTDTNFLLRPHPILLEQQIGEVEAGVLMIQAQAQQVALASSSLNTNLPQIA
jgi:hypothetical protein